MLHARLQVLGARLHEGLGGLRQLVTDALWPVAFNAPDEETIARRYRTKIKQRVYLARYLPGIPPAYWDAMSSREVLAYLEETSTLVTKENGHK